jgi:hypothetical protein
MSNIRYSGDKMGKRTLIDAELADKVLDDFRSTTKELISLKEFVQKNFDVFERSGRGVKSIYEFLQAGGLDVGSYQSFQKALSEARQTRNKKEVGDAEECVLKK